MQRKARTTVGIMIRVLAHAETYHPNLQYFIDYYFRNIVNILRFNDKLREWECPKIYIRPM